MPALLAGELHLDLHGEKLRGGFVVVRTKAASSGKEESLILHKYDEDAMDWWDTEDHSRSVLSGRTNDELKADPDRLWRSDLPASQANVVLKSDAIAQPTQTSWTPSTVSARQVEQLFKAVGAVVADLVRWKWQVHDRGGLARLESPRGPSFDETRASQSTRHS